MKFLKTIAPAALSELWEKVSGNIVPKDTSANVGIGTDSPSERLEVAGNVNQSDGSPEYHFETTSASHYNWRIACQENVSNGFEIASGTQSSSAPDDTYTNRLVIKADTGDITVDSGNLVVGTAGKGIDFSNQTPAAGMTSELLDHYEEGTWTAGITGATVDSLENATGYYTRVGNLVHFQWYSGEITLSSSSGAAIISGLPFTSRSESQSNSVFQYVHGTAVDGSTTGGYVSSGGTTMYFIDAASTSTATYIDSGTRYIMVSGAYTV